MVAVSVPATVTVRFLPPLIEMVSPLVNDSDPVSPAKVKDPAASSTQQMMAPDELVVSSVQLGRLKRKSFANIPPVKVEVPVPVSVICPLPNILPAVNIFPVVSKTPSVVVQCLHQDRRKERGQTLRRFCQ